MNAVPAEGQHRSSCRVQRTSDPCILIRTSASRMIDDASLGALSTMWLQPLRIIIANHFGTITARTVALGNWDRAVRPSSDSAFLQTRHVLE